MNNRGRRMSAGPDFGYLGDVEASAGGSEIKVQLLGEVLSLFRANCEIVLFATCGFVDSVADERRKGSKTSPKICTLLRCGSQVLALRLLLWLLAPLLPQPQPLPRCFVVAVAVALDISLGAGAAVVAASVAI